MHGSMQITIANRYCANVKCMHAYVTACETVPASAYALMKSGILDAHLDFLNSMSLGELNVFAI